MQNHVRNMMHLEKDCVMKSCQVIWPFCVQMQSKARKRIENERIFTFQAFVKKANHLAHFNE